MSVDFTPSRGEYTELKPFRYWCQKVLPLVYDDSLSYYELLSKILDSLNKAMEDVETLNDDVTALYTAYTSLQNWITNYVETFFEGEGISNAVDDAIDRMVVSGEFGSIVNDKVAAQINAVVASQLGTVVQGQLPSVVQTQIPGVVQSQLPGVVNNQIGDVVENWLEANITPDTTLLDRTINATNKAPSAYDMKNMIQAMKSNYSFIDKYTMFDYPGDITPGRNDLAVMEYMTRTYGETVSNRTVFMCYFKKGNSLILYSPNSDDLDCYPSLIPITRNLLPPLSADFATVSQTMPTIPNVATSYNTNALLKYFVNLKSGNTVKIDVDITVTNTGSETPVVCLTGWKLVKVYVYMGSIVTQNLANFVVTGSVASGNIHAECKYTFGDINKEAYDNPATVGFGLAILTGDTSVELTTYQEFEGEAVTYSDNTNFFPKDSGFNMTITGEVIDATVDDLNERVDNVDADINRIETGEDVVFSWAAGKNYYNNNGHMGGADTGVQDYAITPANPNYGVKRSDIGAVYAKDGYAVSVFLTETNEVNPTIKYASGYTNFYVLPDDYYKYYLYLSVHKRDNTAITALEASENVLGVPVIKSNFDEDDKRIAKLEAVIPTRENLFDTNDDDIVDGSIITSVSNGSAVWSSFPNYIESGYVPITANEKIAFYIPSLNAVKTDWIVAWFDSNKDILSTRSYATNGVYTAPANTAYARVAVYKAYIDTAMFIKVLPSDPVPFTGAGIEYVPYGGYNMSAFATKDKCPGYQWVGKKWYAYGTSITANNGQNGRKTYVNYMSQMSGLIATNKGVGGGGIGNFGAYSTGQVYSAICNITDGKLDADVISLETGANDVNADVPLGTIYDEGQTTLAGCLNDCLRYLQANTNAQIFVTCSPATTTKPNASGNYYEWQMMVEQICHLNKVHYLNSDNNMGYAKIADATKGQLYVRDDIHQTELGAYIMAENLWYQLKNIPLFYTAIPS